MTSHDGSTEHGISGRLWFYPGDPTDGHRVSGPDTRFCLGHLDIAGYLPCLAEQASRLVRFALEHAARQYRAHGAGILSAVMALSLAQLTSERSPLLATGGYPGTTPLFRREYNDH